MNAYRIQNKKVNFLLCNTVYFINFVRNEPQTDPETSKRIYKTEKMMFLVPVPRQSRLLKPMVETAPNMQLNTRFIVVLFTAYSQPILTY